MRSSFFPGIVAIAVAACGSGSSSRPSAGPPPSLAGPSCPNAAACFSAGEDLRHGANGQAKDAARAAVAYQKSCDLSHAGACDALAMLYYGGEGVPKDAPKGDALADRACALRHAPACLGLAYVLATNVNQLMAGQGEVSEEERGRLTDQLRAKAQRYLKQACEFGNPCACVAIETGECNRPELCAAKNASGACLTKCSEELGCDSGVFAAIMP